MQLPTGKYFALPFTSNALQKSLYDRYIKSFAGQVTELIAA